MSNIVVLFILLSIINVVASTAKSILTIKGDKWIASLVSGGYFAFYNVVLLYTVADFPMWQKCIITFGCNVVGVYVVKLVEEKLRKDRLWKIEATFHKDDAEFIHKKLKRVQIPHNYFNVNRHTVFNIYCENQRQSAYAHRIIDRYNGKYFISESKVF